MRAQLITMGLLAVALQGCGEGATSSAGAPPAKFVASSKAGRAPAVLLVMDAKSSAPESAQLADQGVASMAVAPTSTLPRLRAAVKALRARPDVDGGHLALVAQGADGAATASLLKTEPAIGAAVFADADEGVAAPLGDVRGALVLLQRGGAGGGVEAIDRSLAAAAPPGTVLRKYKDMSDQARSDRDTWLLRILAS